MPTPQRRNLVLLNQRRLNTLLDTFSDTRSAGAVNGTAADTGQLRTIVDANSKLSVGSGVLNFATGGGGTNDPMITYVSEPIISGKILMMTVTPADLTSDLRAGADTGSGNTSVRFFSNLRVAIAGTLINLGITIVGATSYQIALIFRTSGVHMLIKGGTFTNWTLIWSTLTSLGTTFTPRILASSATTIGTVDNVRIPYNTFIPLALALDTFVRSNGAIGSTNGFQSGGESNGGSGLAWTGSTWTIVSNKAVNTPTQGADVIVNGSFAADANWTKGTGWTIAGGVGVGAAGSQSDITQAVGTTNMRYLVTFTISSYVAGTASVLGGAGVGTPRSGNGTFSEVIRTTSSTIGIRKNATGNFSIDNVSFLPLTPATLYATVAPLPATADIQISVDLTITAGYKAGLILNLDSTSNPQNFIVVEHDGVAIAQLIKVVAGTYTTVTTSSATYSAGATLRVTKSGTSYALYYNNALIGTIGTVSDAGIISNTIHGMFSTSANDSLANFDIRPMGTGNEYSRLDSI